MSKRFKPKERPQVNHDYRSAVYIPSRLEIPESVRLVKVFVEGYDDVAFWRGIFDHFETDQISFEISVPPRADMAKGKKVLMEMIPESSAELFLCVDSDFDHLFGNHTEQSRAVNGANFMFHTYTYATENFLCYAPSLHGVCVRATKNDTRIFDFEQFMAKYSQTIYPLFLWYAYSARQDERSIFTLIDFKTTVKLNYLEVENNGESTLGWLHKQVEKKLHGLERNNPEWIMPIRKFAQEIEHKGILPENTYLFMQGHTLLDNVVVVMLNCVCDYLKDMANQRIAYSTKRGIALKNEMSNYNNSLRNVRDVLLDNENYKDCFLYQKLKQDIERAVASVVD